MTYQNPIIPGFYPDPSICRVGDTFYLVTSSFQFFPGVPLFESKDLLHWNQIGHVLTRTTQLPLAGAGSTGGIYAPTIRYHESRFYMVTTNVTHGGNFYVYTDDVHGEWSDPIFVEQEGIDPSLYFEDEHCYFMSNGSDVDGNSGIIQCEIDIATGKKLTEGRCIWQGTGGRFLESPHLYRIGDWYYLMASEGGTEYGHMVTYARSKSIYGPFEAYPHNPVLTNRNLGGYPLQGAGHADLVKDLHGNWWMVHLAFRQIHPWIMHHITGRETYLVPVTFDADGWFTAGVNGTSRLTIETDRLPNLPKQEHHRCFTFENTTVGKEWLYLQNPDMNAYRIESDHIALCGKAPIACDTESPTWLGIRQTEMQFDFSVAVEPGRQVSGVTAYMTPSQRYDILLRKTATACMLSMRIQLGSLVHETEPIALPLDSLVTLGIIGRNIQYSFAAVCNGNRYELGAYETRYLSTEVAGNFTGVMLALFAEAAEDSTDAWTVFHSLHYETFEQHDSFA